MTSRGRRAILSPEKVMMGWKLLLKIMSSRKPKVKDKKESKGRIKKKKGGLTVYMNPLGLRMTNHHHVSNVGDKSATP